MDDLLFPSESTVTLIDHMGGDASVVRSARVSVSGLNDVQTMGPREYGLINYLLRERHGSPFEHNAMTFYVEAPIFVFREFMRHRIGFSYNEMSGRYTTLEPRFWIPSIDRPLINVGTSAKPEMGPSSIDVVEETRQSIIDSSEASWSQYQSLLDMGIANEVARAVLPVNVMSQMYVTCNARSMMSFLSLRTHEPKAAHVSRPQLEIEDVARKMEREFGRLFPETWRRFNEHGRVAP